MSITIEQQKFWQDQLAGNHPDVTEDPQCGYYRGTWHKNDKSARPIAIWITEDGEMTCLVGWGGDNFKAKPDTLLDRWLFFCQSPVSYETYLHVYQTGDPWPEEATVEALPGAGHNRPPEGHELHKSNLDALEAALKKQLGIGEAEQDKTWADRTANYRSRILALKREVEDERTKKREPHLEAAAKIQAQYKPLVDALESWNKTIRSALDAWKKRADEAAKRKLVEEAQKVAAGEKSLEEMEVPKEVAAVGGKKAGGTGRATGFRTVRRATITDYDAALKHFAQNSQIKSIVQALCDKDAREGADSGPGWEVIKTSEAS